MRKYGIWRGDPQGTAEDPKRCIVEVHTDYIGHQCTYLRGFGKHGLFCKKHQDSEEEQ